MKYDIIIPVRNREFNRVERCIKSIDKTHVNQIIVIDYGSYDLDTMQKLKGIDKIISIDYKYIPIWNKSHALNIAIKHYSEAQYIITIDCDIIMPDDFLKNCQSLILNNKDIFLTTLNIRRVEINENRQMSFDKLLKISTEWKKNCKFTSQAPGGIQIFPRWWIFEVGGYDETMIYWGGMDTDLWYRAMQTIKTITLPDIILHQEHKKQKEQQLQSTEELNRAKKLWGQRPGHVSYKCSQGIIRQEQWGEI